MPKLSWLKGRVMARLLLLLIPFTIVSCKDDLELDWKVSNKDNVMVVQAPDDHYNPYVNITSYNVSNRHSDCTFGEKTTHLYVYAKQDGKIVDCGQCSADLDSDRKKLTLKYNEKGLIKTTNEHTVYFSQRALTIKDNVPYVKSELNRAGSGYTVGKVTLKTNGATVQGQANGVAERAYIVNRTSSPIMFKHKGFSADELWYYNSAEISLDNMKNVVNGEAVKTDVESEVTEVPLLSDNKWAYVDSHYPPNGKKIKNAALIAEIDGKEVRTSNTLSSNLDIVSGNAYLYVLEWDGKELRFAEDSFGEVSDWSDPSTSGVEVVDYSMEYNAMVINTTGDKVPEVGEYLISDITEKAPMGFLLKTVSTENLGGGKYVVCTQPATLGEVLRAKGVKYQGWLNEESSRQTRGVVVLDETIDKEPMLKMPLKLKFEEKDKETGLKTELAFTINEEFYYIKKYADFYVDSEKDDDTGFKMAFLQTETWNVSGKLSKQLNQKKDLLENIPKDDRVWCNAITIGYISGVPIIVTPRAEFKIPVDVTAAIDANMDLKKSSTLYHVGAKWDGGPAPVFANGEYIYSEDVEIPRDQVPQSQEQQLKMTVGMSASLKPTISLSIGLYGGNLTLDEKVRVFAESITGSSMDVDYSKYIKDENPVEYLTLGADIWLELSAKAKLGIETALHHFRNDTRFIDSFETKLETGITLKATAWKIKSKYIDWEVAGSYPLGPWTIKKIGFPLIYKDFSKIKLSVDKDDRIHVTGVVNHPFLCPFNWFYSYGLCLEKCGGDFFKSYELRGQSVDWEWDKLNSTFEYTLPYKVKDLEKGTTYSIYPYVTTGPIPNTIYRKGVTFVPTESGLSYNAIDDVPGQDF